VLNVVENITLPVLMDGRKVNKERLEELIETLNLKGRENHLPNQLSEASSKGCPLQGIDKCSFGGACGRTHGKPGFENSQEIVNF